MSDRNAARLRVMAELQDGYNKAVHPDWRQQGYPYYRAIWVECAELLDHYGWKWWKHQDGDLEQVRLELVDIWHFGLSDLLRDDRLTDEVLQLLTAPAPVGAAFVDAVEALAASLLNDRRFELPPFVAVMQTLPMSFDELFDLYVGKNVLNGFRLDHGYRDGSYQKVWHGREDNEHLIEVLRELDCEPAELRERLYGALAGRYPG